MRRTVGVRVCLLSAIGLLAGALAADAAPVALSGHYAFNAAQAEATRCLPVSGALLARLQSKAFACDRDWRSDSASGKPAIRCERKHPVAMYFVLKTRADCEDERQTQTANGD